MRDTQYAKISLVCASGPHDPTAWVIGLARSMDILYIVIWHQPKMQGSVRFHVEILSGSYTNQRERRNLMLIAIEALARLLG